MSEDIKRKIHSILAKYRDPISNKYFNSEDPSININLKNNHLNITIEINPSEAKHYEKLKDIISHDLKKLMYLLRLI